MGYRVIVVASKCMAGGEYSFSEGQVRVEIECLTTGGNAVVGPAQVHVGQTQHRVRPGIVAIKSDRPLRRFKSRGTRLPEVLRPLIINFE